MPDTGEHLSCYLEYPRLQRGYPRTETDNLALTKRTSKRKMTSRRLVYMIYYNIIGFFAKESLTIGFLFEDLTGLDHRAPSSK